jgi:hypothetical protein
MFVFIATLSLRSDVALFVGAFSILAAWSVTILWIRDDLIRQGAAMMEIQRTLIIVSIFCCLGLGWLALLFYFVPRRWKLR